VRCDSSLIRVPRPPAKITAFIVSPLVHHRARPSVVSLCGRGDYTFDADPGAAIRLRALVLWRYEGGLQETRQLRRERFQGKEVKEKAAPDLCGERACSLATANAA
jgi:hypothetical protein